MNLAHKIVDAMLGGAAAPVAPPKPTTTPVRPATPARPRPGTRPWNPSVRPGVNPRPKAREEEHAFAEAKQPAERRAEKQISNIGKNIDKVNQRIRDLPAIPGHSPRPRRVTTKMYGQHPKKPVAEGEEATPVPVPPVPPQDDAPAAPSAPAPAAPAPDLCDYIRPGDRVTILTPQNQQISGRAVMRNRQQGCWVLNLGGPHGRPGIASEENIVSIKRGKQHIYGK